MSKNIFRRMTVAATVAALAFALLPASPAAAGAVGVAVEGTATLPSFPDPNGNQGDFQGTATGVIHEQPVTGATARALDFNYTEPNCALGTASGQLTIGSHTLAFQWQRVGATAVVTFPGATGAAVAVFEASSPAGPAALANACAGTGPSVPVTAVVVGAGVIAAH